MKKTGVKLLWGTANLFSHPRYMGGAATNPDPEVFTFAAAQVKKALEITQRLGGANYVLWGGREGYETLLNTDMKREIDQLGRFMNLVVEHKHKIGFKGPLLIEPKPREPTKHQYDYDSATVHAFFQTYGLKPEDFQVNIEANHATLAGHSFEHEVAYALSAGIFGSIDMNRGDPQLGWDTDQFGNDIAELSLVVARIVAAGGFKTGGFNFDAKVRRQSNDVSDLFHGHVGGMDNLARALLIADKMLTDGKLQAFVDERYAGWNEKLGKDILARQAVAGRPVRPGAGRQAGSQAALRAARRCSRPSSTGTCKSPPESPSPACAAWDEGRGEGPRQSRRTATSTATAAPIWSDRWRRSSRTRARCRSRAGRQRESVHRGRGLRGLAGPRVGQAAQRRLPRVAESPRHDRSRGTGGLLPGGRRGLLRLRVADADAGRAQAAGGLAAREAAAGAEAGDGLRADDHPAGRGSAGTRLRPADEEGNVPISAEGFEDLFAGTGVELEALPFARAFEREIRRARASPPPTRRAAAARCTCATSEFRFSLSRSRERVGVRVRRRKMEACPRRRGCRPSPSCARWSLTAAPAGARRAVGRRPGHADRLDWERDQRKEIREHVRGWTWALMPPVTHDDDRRPIATTNKTRFSRWCA